MTLTRPKRNLIKYILLSMLVVAAPFKGFASTTYQPLSTTDFETGQIQGFDTNYGSWYVQANTGDIKITSAPGGKGGNAALVSINKSENYSNVANGVPRAELSSNVKLYLGKDYNLSWKTYMPTDFQFDNSNNRDQFMQVHQTSTQGDGEPPFTIGLAGSKYYYSSYFGNPVVVNFADASGDKGKWVTWNLHYVPSANSSTATTEISKNGQLVAKYTGQNAFSDGTGYLKLGIYKWDWNNVATNVTNRSIYFDDAVISQGAQQQTVSAVPASPSNLTMTNLTKGTSTGNYYVNLKWQDNSNNESGFKILQSINSTSNFNFIKSPGENS
ncbi:MAG: hypothetical protein Q8880_12700, partial [Bacteroidota bacterium]|nr:hypothetical protein [Bacteroidota bacterium]